MIGFFADPYPDELLYSACARYARRTNYLNKQSVITELFGKRGLSAIVDFPTRLQHLISVLPEGHNYSVEKLIDENTLLPFHQPFLPIERAKLVRSEMKEEEDNKLNMRLGTRVKQIEHPKYLRFCPQCVNEDRKKYGETYWHRVHQLAGIVVCSDHQCFIEDSAVELGKVSGSYFHNAEASLPSLIPKAVMLNLEDRNHKILHKIACDAQWLLSQNNLLVGGKVIQERYFNILLKQGFVYYNGSFQPHRFQRISQQFFTPELFKMIGRISKNDNWLSALARISNVNITYHPIRHLLLMTFLGISAEEFFTSFKEFKPFGEPPYPCLNSASRHYGELRIQECRILDNLSKENKKKGIPVGIFTCDCGFLYQRLGPDKSEEDKFTYSYVREYGKIWEDKLTELWADLSLSSVHIGKQLGIHQTSVGRHAIRLNLPMNTETTRSLQGYERHRNPQKPFSELRQDYRNKWLKLRQKYPHLNRKRLSKTANFFYLWLKRYDLEWVENNSPPQNSERNKREHLDWKQIDKKLSSKVEKVCRKILGSKEFPVRVSITEIIKQVGYKAWIDKRHKKLPLTSQVINENLETLESFMLRKIEWVTKKFIEERKIPTLLQFKIRAVVRNKTSDNSLKIQQAIKNSLIEIKESLDFQ